VPQRENSHLKGLSRIKLAKSTKKIDMQSTRPVNYSYRYDGGTLESRLKGTLALVFRVAMHLLTDLYTINIRREMEFSKLY
jgi:hypothetical protein